MILEQINAELETIKFDLLKQKKKHFAQNYDSQKWNFYWSLFKIKYHNFVDIFFAQIFFKKSLKNFGKLS